MKERAKQWAAEKAWVIHVPTRTIGKAVRYYSGDGEDVFPTAFGPVLGFEDGNAFCVKEGAFEALSEGDVHLCIVARTAIAGTVGELALFAAGQGISRRTFEHLMSGILGQQVRALAASKPA